MRKSNRPNIGYSMLQKLLAGINGLVDSHSDLTRRSDKLNVSKRNCASIATTGSCLHASWKFRFGVLVGCLLFGPVTTAEQKYYSLNPEQSNGRFDASISSPQEFIGFEVGERPLHYEEVTRYFRYLAETSSRAHFSRYGETPGGRALINLTISEVGHLQNLAEIKSQHKQIAANPQDNASLIETLPAIVWMGYGIHGDELSSSDAAVMLAYRLTAGEDQVIQDIRSNLVVTVDPMYNPDGRARALGHIEAFRRNQLATDNQDIAHQQFWPGGRGNHYLFDLNRDALFQVQDQSRHRVKAILDANPQLFVDSHEMDWDDTYHFGLPNEPLNPHIPDQVHQSWAEFALDHGAAFDEIGRSYYTRSWNEVFYPGFYEIWSTYFGVTAILYEQAGTSGQSILKSNGKVLSFQTAVGNHFRSSMANLISAAENKNKLVARWAQVQSDAEKGKYTGAQKSWIILPDNSHKYGEILRILLSQGIKVEKLSEPIKAKGLHSYWQDEGQELALPENSLRVDLNQAKANIIHNIFDYHVTMSEKFLKLEKNNLDLGLDSGLYDIGAWSLPLAFNASVFWSEESLRGKWQLVGSPETELFERTAKPAGNYGYVYTDDSLQATARLLQQGVLIRLGKENFVHQKISYPPGSFLVRNEDQSMDVLSALNTEAAAGKINLVSVDSARVIDGPDFGGDEYNLLSPQKIAILGGQGIASTNFGELWHLLDQEIQVPATLINVSQLNFQDLSKYTVILFPETDGDNVNLLQNVAQGTLEQWVRNGGTLITMGSSSLLMAEAGIISSNIRSQVLEDYPPLMIGRTAQELLSDDFLGISAQGKSENTVLAPVVSSVARRFITDSNLWFDFTGKIETLKEWSEDVSLSDKDRMVLASSMRKYLPSGAYLRVDLKPKHFLNYAMGNKTPVLFNNVGDVLIAGKDAELVARYAGPEELMMSGLVWPEATGYIAGTAYLVLEKMGKGKTISFATNPLFRGYSLGTTRMFMNALVLENALDCCS